jgi:hypothetical protein
MRKSTMTMTEEQKPRNIMRADVTIREGFGIEVDGQMKAVFDTKEAAEREARELKLATRCFRLKSMTRHKRRVRDNGRNSMT